MIILGEISAISPTVLLRFSSIKFSQTSNAAGTERKRSSSGASKPVEKNLNTMKYYYSRICQKISTKINSADGQREKHAGVSRHGVLSLKNIRQAEECRCFREKKYVVNRRMTAIKFRIYPSICAVRKVECIFHGKITKSSTIERSMRAYQFKLRCAAWRNKRAGAPAECRFRRAVARGKSNRGWGRE